LDSGVLFPFPLGPFLLFNKEIFGMFELEPEHNLWDAEHPEWFIYDVELLNAWYWEQFENDMGHTGT
jgi:hypothetical protein